MSIQEARRLAFENWHKVCLERSPGQEYYDSDWTDTAWKAWNAALDSVVVELPNDRIHPAVPSDYVKRAGPGAEFNIAIGYNLAKTECREAIETAGVKCK